MDPALLPIGLLLVSFASCLVICDGLIRVRRLRRALRIEWDEIPRDAATGLFDRSVCMQRIAAEVKRSGRSYGSVWVGVVTVLEGDADRFGRMLYDSLRLPEVAFRIDTQVVAIARPELDDASRAELIGRIGAAAPRERLAIGEATWRHGDDGSAADLLRRASSRSVEVSQG